MMKRIVIAGLVVAGAGAGIATHAQSPLRPVAAIPLPNVSGRIDHLAFDARRQRLFVAALGNDTLEVLDTAKGVHQRSVPGFHEPQGLAVITDLNAVAVANGATGTLQLVDAESLQTRWTVHVGGDADNVRYDAASKRVYVAAEGGLFALDPASGRAVERIPIAGHPESFQLEAKGTRVFANLPGLPRSSSATAEPWQCLRDGRRTAVAATTRWRWMNRRIACSSAAAVPRH